MTNSCPSASKRIIFSLEEIKQTALALERDSKEVTVLFNNNSGDHAAPDAKKLQEMLRIQYREKAVGQIDLF